MHTARGCDAVVVRHVVVRYPSPQLGGVSHREDSHDAEHAPLVLVVASSAPVVEALRDHVVHVLGVLPPVQFEREATTQRLDRPLAADEAWHLATCAIERELRNTQKSDDEKFMRRAIELSQVAADGGNFPFGAILVSGDGEVVEEATNCVATLRGDVCSKLL